MNGGCLAYKIFQQKYTFWEQKVLNRFFYVTDLTLHAECFVRDSLKETYGDFLALLRDTPYGRLEH